MMNKTKNTESSYVLRIPLSESETYVLGMELTQKCSEILSKLQAKCDREGTQKIIDNFMFQTRDEIQELNKLCRYELNCECLRFYESGGLRLESNEMRDRLENAEVKLNPNAKRLYERMESLQSLIEEPGYLSNLRKSNSVFVFCMNLRKEAARLLEAIDKIYPVDCSQRAFKTIVELMNSRNITLEKSYNWQQARKENLTIARAV